jgi:signal transduction histidine kinase
MDWRVVVVYLFCYVFVDWVSYVHPVLPLGITPWNPPPSLSLFLLLRFGQRYWPWLLVAALGADAVVRGAPAPWPALLAAAALVTLVYALAAAALRRGLPAGERFGAGRDLALFLAVIVPATLIVATGYVGIFTFSGRVAPANFVPNVFRHWVGDLNGILVFTPLLLYYSERQSWPQRWPRRAILEAAAQALAIAAALWFVFGPVASGEFKFFYLLFLPLVWVGARWGMAGATLALLAIQLGLIAALQAGGYHAATFVQFQFLMLALCVTGLALGAIVAQRRRVEAELRAKQNALSRAQQFAAAGEMTSAMAHELNQPIAALANYLGACQALVRKADADPELLATTMGKAVAQARRASEVVQRLRDFFRRGASYPEEISAAELVDDAMETVRMRAQQANIRMRVRVAPQLPLLCVDPLQISMVLHNLLANAIDAIVQAGSEPREIRIEAAGEDGRVLISVQDSGPGLGMDDLEEIFEPFVTSKPEGMGLGLAVSRSLVRAHGGDLTAVPGRGGARFVVTLPIVQSER